MGEAREVMDRLTAAVTAKDSATLAACYAVDAVAITPDEGEVSGRDAIGTYLLQFGEAFPDLAYDYTRKYEAGDVAIDEGYLTGTHTGPLQLPTGESMPATGKQIRIRSCDIARVENGLVTAHHFYFDQMEFLGQLGLLPDSPS